uniref:Uncharacterized protein n=1 Tax=Pararge aegeria TaxID=116150 RepID=S4PWE6_9NEOP
MTFRISLLIVTLRQNRKPYLRKLRQRKRDSPEESPLFRVIQYFFMLEIIENVVIIDFLISGTLLAKANCQLYFSFSLQLITPLKP